MAGLGRLRNFPEKDFTGQRDGRTFVDQRTSLNRISLDGRPLLEDMVERSLLEYVEMYSSLCV